MLCASARKARMGSNTKKPEVFEILFDEVWSSSSKSFKRSPIIKRDALVRAIDLRNSRNTGKGLSTGNPANFLKDFIRKASCNKRWPQKIKDAKITARQRYGDEQVFEFVPYRPGDSEPFPDRYDPTPLTEISRIEALSLPRSAREMGRSDEAWLTQVVAYQRVVQTHLAIRSTLNVVDLFHLQMSVKAQPEIDAIYLATIKDGPAEFRALVTCEAKQRGQRILEDQIREQVQLAFKLTESVVGGGTIDAVLPMAVAIVGLPHAPRSKGIYIIEFPIVKRSEFVTRYSGECLQDLPLNPISSMIYLLEPPVRGVSHG